MPERLGDDVLADAEAVLGEFAELLGDALPRFPVTLGLPRRRDGRVEGVDEGVHVRGVDVVLLVPRRRGQDDIGEERRTRHPEVERQEQVELALARLLRPHDPLGTVLLTGLGRLDRVVGAEQVLEEVLIALGGGAEEVGAPERQDAREVLGRLRVLDRELEFARLQLRRNVCRCGHSRSRRVVRDRQARLVELRVGRRPAQAGGLREQVHRAATLEETGAAVDVVGVEGVVAVLTGVDVPIGRLVHVPRRPHPVEGKGHVLEAHDRADLLLPDVVRPAATVAALAAGDRGEDQHRPVDLVRVVPVVRAGTHEDHPATLGVDRVLRPLARQAGDLLLRDAGDRRGPRRGGCRRRVVVTGRPGAGQPRALDAVVGEQKVENCCHEPVSDTVHRHAAHLVGHRAVGGVEARQDHGDGLLRCRARGIHAQAWGDVTEVEIPLAHPLLAVAEADRPIGGDDLTGRVVHDHRLPHRVLRGRLGVTVDIPRHEELARRVGTRPVVLQRDQEGHVGEALVVVGEEVDGPVDEVLLEQDVTHGHRQGTVGAGGGRHPLVGELHVLGIVRRDGDDLLAAIARLGHPVGVRRAGQRDIGAPHDEVARVPPVAGLGDIGLVTEHLRRGVG